jgi:hypothetical protein
MSKEILLAWKGYNEKSTGTFVDVEERTVVYLDTEPIWAKMYSEQEVANKANGYNVYAKETKAPIFNEGFIAGAKWQQEQDKNRLLEYVKQEACDNCNNDVCCCIIKKQETLEKVSPMNDLLKDLRETKISVKESIDTIEDEFMRTQINIFVQKTLDSVIYRIENELLEIESKWQQEQMFDIMQQYTAFCVKFAKEWFEQFKNK